MWPRLNSGNVSSSNFNLLQFWIHGGPLFFGNKMSVEVISRCDLASVLHCSYEVQIDMANDDKVQQTILYHLNMEHAIAEIREMDYLQFVSDYERWSQGWLSAILDIMDMWGPIRDGGVKLGFFENKKA